MLNSLGPDDGGEEDGEGQRRQGEPRIRHPHHHLVGPAAEIARDDAEKGADGAGEQHGGDADDHRHASAEDQPRQHIAADLVGAERVRHAAAFLPGRRTVAKRQGADLWIVRRQHVGKDAQRRR